MDEQFLQSIRSQCAVVRASCANAHLRSATRAVTQLYAKFLAPSGLEPTQFTLLVACAVAGDVPISILANRLVMDRTTLARNLKPLEGKGLVEVATGEDRRERMVSINEKGYSTLAVAYPLWQEAQKQIVDGFGRKRLDDLLQDLSAITELVQEA